MRISFSQSDLGHPVQPVLLVGALLFGGIGAGVSVTCALAPGSETALIAGFLMLPVSFGIGMLGWYAVPPGISIRMCNGRFFRHVLTHGLQASVHREISSLDPRPLPATRVFVPATVAIAFLTGWTVARCVRGGDPRMIITVYASLGLGYSLLVTWMARQGHLPPPRRPR